MSIFAIGDLHLSYDERVEKPMDIFGDHWKNHGEKVQEYWKAMVSPDDTVIIPGDVSWGLRLEEAMADLEWIHRLPGFKVITKGNHDLWWQSITKLNSIFDDMVFLQNHTCLVKQGEENVAICGTRGWICPGTEGFDAHDRKIFDREMIRLRFSLEEAKASEANRIICALHYPPTNDKMQGSGFTDMLEKYGVSTCIYGHLHGVEAFKNGISGRMNGVEYKLVSLDFLECQPKKIL